MKKIWQLDWQITFERQPSPTAVLGQILAAIARGRAANTDVAKTNSGWKGESEWEAKAAFAWTRDWKI